LPDFVYLRPTISSLRYVCHLVLPELLHWDLLHRERFAALVRRFAQLTNSTVPRFIRLACQLTTYTAMSITLDHDKSLVRHLLLVARHEICARCTQPSTYKCTFYRLCLGCPVMSALFLDLLVRLPVLKAVHVCLVDSYLKMPAIPPSFLLPPPFLWTQPPVCQSDLNAIQYQIRDVSDCSVHHFL
jgi:hypothetical protein